MAEDHSHPSPTPDEPPTISITVSKGGKQLNTFNLPEGAILNDLLIACEDHLSAGAAAAGPEKYDWDKAKFIAKGKMLRAADQGDHLIAHLDNTKVTLQVPRSQDIQDLRASSEAARSRDARRQAQLQAAARRRKATAAAPRRQNNQAADAEYTFLRVEPLPGLPDPDRSRAYLERLKADPGIRAVMRRHKFSVGLLTEMDPASNTRATHEGTTRLLGLNRNRGEAIELRLRTDAGDGYRGYGGVRDTLCHELAHNVFGPHDRDFWELCRRVEREVRAADWRGAGGRAVGGGEVYEGPGEEEGDEEDDVPDHGGWSGGTYVLGGGGSVGAGAGVSSGGGGGGAQGLNRRDVIARAAEERLRRRKQQDPDGRGSGAEGGSSAA